jgi:hypothetical protein
LQLKITRRHLAQLLIGMAVCLVMGLSGLFLVNVLTPRGEVHGTARFCQWGGSYCKPLPGATISLVRDSDHSTYTVRADSKGWYSISLPAGHYTLHGFIDAGPRQLSAAADQRVLADYEVWSLPQ